MKKRLCLYCALSLVFIVSNSFKQKIYSLGNFSLKKDSISAVYYKVSTDSDTSYFIKPNDNEWQRYSNYTSARIALVENATNLKKYSKIPLKPISKLINVEYIGTMDSQTKSANGLVMDSTTLYAQTADATNPGMMSTSTQSIAGAKTFTTSISSPLLNISGNGTIGGTATVGSKVNIATPSGSAGSINTNQDGVYSYRNGDANRYIRFNTSGTFNDLLSTGAPLVVNFGFAVTPQNVSFFGGNTSQLGQLSIGNHSPGISRFSVKGKNTNNTGYAIMAYDSNESEKFSVRNDGEIKLNGSAISLAGAFATSGVNSLTLTTTGTTNITLPSNGTLSTLAGNESLTNKKLGSLTTNGLIKTSGGDGTLSVATVGTDYAAPTGEEGYIQNQKSGQQEANVNIKGDTFHFQNTDPFEGASGPDYNFFEVKGTSGTNWLTIDRYGMVNVHEFFASGDITTPIIHSGYAEVNALKVSDLTLNGLVKTSSGNGTISLATSGIDYLDPSHLSGTSGYYPKFTASNTIGDGVLYQSSEKVGLGTTSPGARLSIVSNPSIANVALDISGNNNSTASPDINIRRASSTVNVGEAPAIQFNDESTSSAAMIQSGNGSIQFFNNSNGVGWNERMRIDSEGNIGIGTSSPGTHKLAVNGSIHTTEVKVDLTGWPDYVFAKDYSLLSLKEIEKYIKEKHHLPEMPSAKEVEKEGIRLGEMNAKLLQKIEELTLHLIEQSKRSDKLERLNEEQQKEINHLKSKL